MPNPVTILMVTFKQTTSECEIQLRKPLPFKDKHTYVSLS